MSIASCNSGPEAAPWAGRPSPARAALKRPATPREWRLQAAAVTALQRARMGGWPIRVAGDMNAARRTLRETGLAVATGMRAGEPDLRVYMPGARLLLIEYKRGKTGRASAGQIEAHAELTRLGFDVITLAPANEDEAAAQTLAEVSARLAMPIPPWPLDKTN